MNNSIAIIIAGAIVAASILVAGHWQLTTNDHGVTTRLDRWTGAVVRCGFAVGEDTVCRTIEFNPL